jgi:amidase
VLFEEACEHADPQFHPLLERVFGHLQAMLPLGGRRARLCGGEDLDSWRHTYVTIGAHEVWQIHGDWISTHNPDFSPEIAARFLSASRIEPDLARQAARHRTDIIRRIQSLLQDDEVLVLPSAASAAPCRDASDAEIESVRQQTMRICCFAGLSGRPQVNMPLTEAGGLPAGISLIGPRGSDRPLITLAVSVWRALHA